MRCANYPTRNQNFLYKIVLHIRHLKFGGTRDMIARIARVTNRLRGNEL